MDSLWKTEKHSKKWENYNESKKSTCVQCVQTVITQGEGRHGPSQKSCYKHSQIGIHKAPKKTKSASKNNGITKQLGHFCLIYWTIYIFI